MAVEIRQLVVKSNLVSGERDRPDESKPPAVNVEQLRQTLLAECRELIAEALSSKRER